MNPAAESTTESTTESIAESTTESVSDRYAQIQRQFDQTPYPRIAIDAAPDSQPEEFHAHGLVTAFYARDRKVIDPQGMTILDVGCGSGFKALMLAHLNPGTTITGIDLSPASIEVAIERFRRFEMSDRAQFQVLNIDQLSTLNQQFDYINCDEVLYLMEDPLASLQAIARLLKPSGIIRVNLHSLNERIQVLSSQKFMREIGAVAPDLDEKTSMDLVEQVVLALNPRAVDVRKMWDRYNTSDPDVRARILASNFMLHGDRGFSVPEVFELVESAGLQAIAPVEPQDWDLQVAIDQDKLPAALRPKLDSLSLRDQMHWHDLLISRNRLIDLFCSPQAPLAARSAWSAAELATQAAQIRVTLHPLLTTEAFRAALVDACRYLKPLDFTRFLERTKGIGAANANLLPILVPLLDRPQLITDLVDRLLIVRPLHPIDQTPIDRASATQTVCDFLATLAQFAYVLCEQLD